MRTDFDDIIEKIEEKIEDWWPWHWGDDDDENVNPNLNPVLLVPGIGGSILNAVNERGHKERIWVRLFAADHEFRAKLFSLYDPLTGKTNSLDPKTTIEVPDDRFGLYSCDILDPDVILRMDIVYYFHDLIEQMTNWGYKEGTTLFGFGLAEHLDKLKVKLESMYNASGGKKVNIVSHSMGGLLVKSFLALHRDFFEQYVNNWIAVAVPFQGAPGFIMDCLLTGVEFVKGWERELFVAKWSMHQLLIECPSVYELLASPDFPWVDPPELQLWRRQGEDGEVKLERHGPKDYLKVMSAALEGNTMNYNGMVIPTPMNKDILQWALKTSLILQTAELPEGVKFYNVVGTSYDTPFHTCYGSKDKPVENLADVLDLEAEFSYVDGDGTVPIESSMADGLNAELRIGIPGDHRAILNDDRLFRILKHWLKAGDPDPCYNPVWDFVFVPRPNLEADSHKEEIVVTTPSMQSEWVVVPKDEEVDNQMIEADDFAVGVTIGSETRAEAHAKINSFPSEFDETCLKISTVGVAEGMTLAALDEVMVVASEQAVAAHTRTHKGGFTCLDILVTQTMTIDQSLRKLSEDLIISSQRTTLMRVTLFNYFEIALRLEDLSKFTNNEVFMF